MLSEVLLTGMPSPGKARLKAALEAAGLALTSPAVGVRVHAESDLEALLEPELQRAARDAASHADIVVEVDWEPTEDSVRRVIAFLERQA
jgi:predicted ATPase